MADNRQFADHGVIGGVDVFYEDKKLAESPSQSSVASTDYFVLKDTDGVPHKIVKSDVLEMVRDAMGTILANNNKGTSVAKVPTIGSSGNDLGSSSVADLASVLGVGIVPCGLPTNRDLDNAYGQQGTIKFFYSYGDYNHPTDSNSGVVISCNALDTWASGTSGGFNNIVQIFFGESNGKMYIRYYNKPNQTWGNWAEKV